MAKKGWPTAVAEYKTKNMHFPRGTRKTTSGAIVARTVGTVKKGR